MVKKETPVYAVGQQLSAEEAEDYDLPTVEQLKVSIRNYDDVLAAGQSLPVAMAVKAFEDELEAYRIEHAE